MAEEQQNTGIQFEDILPWGVTGGDTGLSSRLKLKRNFERIKAWMDSLSLNVTAEDKLSREEEDYAEEQVGFLKGLWIKAKGLFGFDENGDVSARDVSASGNVNVGGDVVFGALLKSLGAVGGFETGRGITMDAEKGTIEADGLDVRGFMRAMELIVNSLKLMESDYSFTEGGTTEKIHNNQDGTLVLTIHKEHDGDVTPFEQGDILEAKVNDLLGHGTHYTVWMLVTGKDSATNELTVTLYDGGDVQGGRNFTPMGTDTATDWYATEHELTDGSDEYGLTMNVTRWGNVNVLPGGAHNPRQDSWHLSTTDRRLVFLRNVTTPKLTDENYGLVLGFQPELGIFPSTLDYSIPYLYAGGLIVDHQHIHHVNYPVPQEYTVEDCGEWQRYGADGTTPRVYYRKRWTEANGQAMAVAQQVRHGGRVWLCNGESVTSEPAVGNTDWVCTSTLGTYRAEVTIRNAYTNYKIGKDVDVEVSLTIYFGDEDVTAEVLGNQHTLTWSRYTGYADGEYVQTEEDAEWEPAFVDGDQNRVNLTGSNLGEGWMEEYDSVLIGCEAEFSHGGETHTLTAGLVVQGVPEGPQGENALHVEVIGPNIIKNGVGTITLTAYAFDGDEDVSASLQPSAYSWERTSLHSANEESDAAWNAAHRGYGRTLTVDQRDIFVRAWFQCVVNFGLKLVQSMD